MPPTQPDSGTFPADPARKSTSRSKPEAPLREMNTGYQHREHRRAPRFGPPWGTEPPPPDCRGGFGRSAQWVKTRSRFHDARRRRRRTEQCRFNGHRHQHSRTSISDHPRGTRLVIQQTAANEADLPHRMTLVLLGHKPNDFGGRLFCGSAPFRARPTRETLRGI